jgi:hypothetical protein
MPKTLVFDDVKCAQKIRSLNLQVPALRRAFSDNERNIAAFLAIAEEIKTQAQRAHAEADDALKTSVASNVRTGEIDRGDGKLKRNATETLKAKSDIMRELQLVRNAIGVGQAKKKEMLASTGRWMVIPTSSKQKADDPEQLQMNLAIQESMRDIENDWEVKEAIEASLVEKPLCVDPPAVCETDDWESLSDAPKGRLRTFMDKLTGKEEQKKRRTRHGKKKAPVVAYPNDPVGPVEMTKTEEVDLTSSDEWAHIYAAPLPDSSRPIERKYVEPQEIVVEAKLSAIADKHVRMLQEECDIMYDSYQLHVRNPHKTQVTTATLAETIRKSKDNLQKMKDRATDELCSCDPVRYVSESDRVLRTYLACAEQARFFEGALYQEEGLYERWCQYDTLLNAPEQTAQVKAALRNYQTEFMENCKLTFPFADKPGFILEASHVQMNGSRLVGGTHILLRQLKQALSYKERHPTQRVCVMDCGCGSFGLERLRKLKWGSHFPDIYFHGMFSLVDYADRDRAHRADRFPGPTQVLLMGGPGARPQNGNAVNTCNHTLGTCDCFKLYDKVFPLAIHAGYYLKDTDFLNLWQYQHVEPLLSLEHVPQVGANIPTQKPEYVWKLASEAGGWFERTGAKIRSFLKARDEVVLEPLRTGTTTYHHDDNSVRMRDGGFHISLFTRPAGVVAASVKQAVKTIGSVGES